MNTEHKKAVFALFAQYVTPERAQALVRYAQQRTNYLSLVLEDINQSHNISAIVRSCDCFGVQQVHVIEERHTYVENIGISKGASKWLDIHRYRTRGANNTENCFAHLKEQGYKILATTPHTNDVLIDQVSLDTKIALVFGTEERGLSQYALDNADGFVKIPMWGFTQSFNVSVSAAIALYELSKRLRASNYPWQLTEHQMLDLQLDWLGRTTNRTHEIHQALKQGS